MKIKVLIIVILIIVLFVLPLLAGAWSQGKNMGEGINSGTNDICPVVSPDGKYLFFISTRNGVGGVYWGDASIIDRLKN